MDVVLLSRIQYALTSMFHYIYPPLSIGLGLMLVIIEGMYVRTKNPHYKMIAKFWVKVFGLTFALGVATGLVQLFGFGTNWSRYSRFIGDVFGSALGAEGVFAFFLEAGFLGVMMFGWDRVSVRFHYLSTILVSLGSHFSAVWIVVANSWMQTPAGFKIISDGVETKAVVTDLWQMIFNPSSVDRLVHVILGCWLAGIFLVISVSAYYFLKGKHLPFAKTGIKFGLISSSIVLVLQLISADSTAEGVAKHQPAKLAAMEGVYKTEPYTPLYAFGWVDADAQEVHGLKIPGLLSFLTYKDASKPVPGLDTIPRDEWPNVPLVFQAYHMMIAMWGSMVFATALGLYVFYKGKIDKAKWILRLLVLSVIFPQLANQCGWVTAEAGRQPWLVYKLLRTSEGISANIKASQVAGSITMFVVIYILLFCLFTFLLDRKIKHGPSDDSDSSGSDVYTNPFKE
ncbi:MAG: cytochrome ubiquinol oxidase subunit I [Chlamydiae bacterium]|nr:cytochrome ubiquinol oxidase subunit I [Chlamydiota bacterium]